MAPSVGGGGRMTVVGAQKGAGENEDLKDADRGHYEGRRLKENVGNTLAKEREEERKREGER